MDAREYREKFIDHIVLIGLWRSNDNVDQIGTHPERVGDCVQEVTAEFVGGLVVSDLVLSCIVKFLGFQSLAGPLHAGLSGVE
jgi:hypothetical protein